MKQAEQVRQIRELVASIDEHIVPDAGKIVSCPMSAFTDPELAAEERETLFQNHPQMIGLSGELPGPNTYLALNDFGIPVLATRNTEGKFRAFINSCRHRGAQVTRGTRGKQSRFICPYHAWTYDSDGALVSLREEALFGSIDKSCNGLIELPAEEKYGMLWIHPRPDGELSIDALVGPELAAELASWNFGQSIYATELTLDRPLNWKLASDTFCEAYHFAVLHSKTVANLVHGDFTTYREFGNNHCMVVPNRNIKSILGQPEDKWRLAPLSSVAYYLFPNVHMISNGNILSVTRIFPSPKGPGHSVSRITIFQSDHLLPAGEEADEVTVLSGDNVYSADIDRAVTLDVSTLLQLFDTTVEQEDYTVATQIQVSADSGVVEAIKFGRNEPGVQHAHNAIRAALGRPALPELA